MTTIRYGVAEHNKYGNHCIGDVVYMLYANTVWVRGRIGKILEHQFPDSSYGNLWDFRLVDCETLGGERLPDIICAPDEALPEITNPLPFD